MSDVRFSTRVLEGIKEWYFPEIWYVIESWLSFSKDKNILVIGGTIPHIPEAFAKAGWQVTCVDYDLSQLMSVQERFKDSKLTGRFELTASEKLPFPSETFQTVICLNYLEFSSSPGKVMIEVKRVMRVGGKAVIGGFKRMSPWTFPSVYQSLRRGEVKENPNFLTRNQLMQAIKACGLVLEQAKERARYLPIKTFIGKIGWPMAGAIICLASKVAENDQITEQTNLGGRKLNK